MKGSCRFPSAAVSSRGFVKLFSARARGLGGLWCECYWVLCVCDFGKKGTGLRGGSYWHELVLAPAILFIHSTDHSL